MPHRPGTERDDHSQGPEGVAEVAAPPMRSVQSITMEQREQGSRESGRDGHDPGPGEGRVRPRSVLPEEDRGRDCGGGREQDVLERAQPEGARLRLLAGSPAPSRASVSTK